MLNNLKEKKGADWNSEGRGWMGSMIREGQRAYHGLQPRHSKKYHRFGSISRQNATR